MKSSVIVGLSAILLAGCIPATRSYAEVQQKRHLVTTEMIVSAMQQRQLPIEGVQIRISAPITSVSANPMLDVQTVSLTGTGSAQLRLACRSRNDCSPFYVAANWPESTKQTTLTSAVANPAGKSVPAAETAALMDQSATPGKPAVLLIEDEKVHIRLRVVYLQSGSVGETVRVATPDRKQSFKAQMVSPTLLKGSF